MAENAISILIRTENQTREGLQQAVSQLREVRSNIEPLAPTQRRTAETTRELDSAFKGLGSGSTVLREALGRISPEAAQATASLERMLTAAGRVPPAFLLGTLAVTGLGVATVALGAQLANTVEKLDKLSFATGIGVEELQVLRQVLEDSGSSPEVLTEPLRRLSREIEAGNPLLRQLGITATDTFGAFRQLAEILTQTDDEGKRNTIMFALLGRAGSDVAAALREVSRGYAETEARMVAAGALVREDVLPAARALDQQMDELKTNWKGVWTQMQTDALPASSVIVDALNQLAFRAQLSMWSFRNLREEMTKAFQLPTGQLRAGPRGGAFPGITDPGFQEVEGELIGPPATAAPSAPDDKSPRAKRIEELREIIRGTALEARGAVRILDELERGDRANKLEAILKALPDANDLNFRVVLSTDDAEEKARALLQLFGEVRNKEGQIVVSATNVLPDPKVVVGRPELPKPAELVPDVELQFDQLTQVQLEWQNTVDEMLGAGAVLKAGLGAVFSGLQSGFATVFQGLLGTAQTFKSAMVTIIKSMVDEMIAQLARLAAAKFLKLILSLLPVPGALIAAASVPLINEIPTPMPSLAPAPLAPVSALAPAATLPVASSSVARSGEPADSRSEARASDRRQAPTVHLHVSTLDVHGFVDSFYSPNGAFRRTLQDAATLAAY